MPFLIKVYFLHEMGLIFFCLTKYGQIGVSVEKEEFGKVDNLY
jgi:hypothetical protein